MNALEIRDLSKNYGNFNLSHLNLKEYNHQADLEYDTPGWRKYFCIRKRQCDRDAGVEGRYRRCVG